MSGSILILEPSPPAESIANPILKNLKITFYSQQNALLFSIIVRGMMGQTITTHGGFITNLLDEASIEKIASSIREKIWGRFMIFGNINAGLFGIFVILRGVKLTLDTILHGYPLHSIYGCSCYLIGSLWDSLTQLLLLLGGKKTAKQEKTSTELQEVVRHNNPTDILSQLVTIEPPRAAVYRQLRTVLSQEEGTPYILGFKG